MRTPEVMVAGLGLWLPGHAGVAAWSTGTPDPDAHKPLGSSLGRINRRRACLLDRALADVAAEAAASADVDPASVSTVVGSAIGEASTMIGLLEQMWRSRTPMSPAAFTMSVHNAASGLISISNQNHGFTTSLAADESTPAAALVEAIGLVLTTGEPVVVACGEETAPVDLVSDEETWNLLAAAVVLAPPRHPGQCLARLRVSDADDNPIAPPDLEPALARNPQVGLVDLVDAVRRAATGTVRLDRGLGNGLCAEIVSEPR